MTPLDFLTLLWQNKPEELYILIWVLEGKVSHWFRALPDAAEFLQTHQTDVYVGVGLAKQDYGSGKRCVSGEIMGIAGMFADLDIKSVAHPKDLPASIEESLTLIPTSLPPTIIIATGNGLQAWWLFREPWIFETESDRMEAAALSARFHTFLRYRSSERGWGFDRLSDLARVLRIPGTVNGKDPNQPRPVTVHSFEDRRYNPSELQDYLDDLSISDTEAEQNAEKDWKERFADKPITVNLSARIPQEMLDRWREAEPRFRDTWFRQRADLNDSSQSGYDMALACFGVAHHLGDQQIVDLIIHHRFHHCQKQRTRIDYFQRTISKAENGLKQSTSIALGDSARDSFADSQGQAELPLPTNNSDPKPAEPGIAKALNWDRISDALGIRIYRMVKITGKDPVYRMEAEGGKIEFSNIRRLSSQQNFRMTIAAAINKYPRKLKPVLWNEISQLILDSLTLEDGGEEMHLEGAAKMYVRQYLADIGFIESVERENSQNARKPLILDGCITICASDLQIYINKNQGQSMSIPKVTAMLSVLDAQSFRHHKKRVDQGRWRLPVADFDPAQYSADYLDDNKYVD